MSRNKLPCANHFLIHQSRVLRKLREIEIGSDALAICRKDYHFGVVRGNLFPVVVQNNVAAKVSVADRVAAKTGMPGISRVR